MTRDYFLKFYSYDRDTGIFTRIDRKGSGGGSLDKDGYLILKIKGKQYKSHRMAWLCCYGEMPFDNIDHINRDKTDNRIINLRCVDQAINSRNLTVRIDKVTGKKGINFDRTRGLKANFTTKIQGKRYRFKTLDLAVEFREKELKNLGYGDGHF